MIIWLASYPKSGNTWLRALISSYYFSKEGSFNFNLLKEIDSFPSPRFFRKYSDKFKVICLLFTALISADSSVLRSSLTVTSNKSLDNY